MDKKELHISFNAELCEYDTENQTFGCRQNNPDICGKNGIEGVCAFYLVLCQDLVQIKMRGSAS